MSGSPAGGERRRRQRRSDGQARPVHHGRQGVMAQAPLAMPHAAARGQLGAAQVGLVAQGRPGDVLAAADERVVAQPLGPVARARESVRRRAAANACSRRQPARARCDARRMRRRAVAATPRPAVSPCNCAAAAPADAGALADREHAGDAGALRGVDDERRRAEALRERAAERLRQLGLRDQSPAGGERVAGDRARAAALASSTHALDAPVALGRDDALAARATARPQRRAQANGLQRLARMRGERAREARQRGRRRPPRRAPTTCAPSRRSVAAAASSNGPVPATSTRRPRIGQPPLTSACSPPAPKTPGSVQPGKRQQPFARAGREDQPIPAQRPRALAGRRSAACGRATAITTRVPASTCTPPARARDAPARARPARRPRPGARARSGRRGSGAASSSSTSHALGRRRLRGGEPGRAGADDDDAGVKLAERVRLSHRFGSPCPRRTASGSRGDGRARRWSPGTRRRRPCRTAAGAAAPPGETRAPRPGAAISTAAATSVPARTSSARPSTVTATRSLMPATSTKRAGEYGAASIAGVRPSSRSSQTLAVPDGRGQARALRGRSRPTGCRALAAGNAADDRPPVRRRGPEAGPAAQHLQRRRCRAGSAARAAPCAPAAPRRRRARCRA